MSLNCLAVPTTWRTCMPWSLKRRNTTSKSRRLEDETSEDLKTRGNECCIRKEVRGQHDHSYERGVNHIRAYQNKLRHHDNRNIIESRLEGTARFSCITIIVSTHFQGHEIRGTGRERRLVSGDHQSSSPISRRLSCALYNEKITTSDSKCNIGLIR